jgi:hypothetical protein
MDDETKRLAKEKRDYVEQWLANFDKASAIAPSMRQVLEVEKWQYETIVNAPSAAIEIPSQQLNKELDQELQEWKVVLPPMPHYDVGNVNRAIAGTTVSILSLYTVVQDARQLPSEEVQSWSRHYATAYEDIQKLSERRTKVRDLLLTLNPARANEFDIAVKNYEEAIGGWREPESAEIAIRNVLEHYKGDLLEKAKQKEQKVSWATMADRLSAEPMGTPAHQQLIDQEKIWNELHSTLTKIAKRLNVSADLIAVHTKFLDHLFIVLSLIKI